MNIDSLVDRLAFKHGTPRVSSCLGMYLSPEVVYVAEARPEGAEGKPRVQHLLRIPMPPLPGLSAKPASQSTLSTDFLADNAKIVETIRAAMRTVSWDSKFVTVSLSHHLGLLRYFTMPVLERRFWKTAIPLEARKYVPIPFEMLSQDYQVVSLARDANVRQGVLFAVTQRKNIAAIAALMESLGLVLAGIEVAPGSVSRLMESLEPKRRGQPYAHVHFDKGEIRIVVADKGIPVFFRDIFLGSSLSEGDLRRIDLGGCISFAQKQLGVGALSQVSVSSSSISAQPWEKAFSQELGVKVQLSDNSALLNVKSLDWGALTALGASLRYSHKAFFLDLAQIGRINDEERKAAKIIFGCFGVVAMGLFVVGLYRAAGYYWKTKELTQYKMEDAVEAVFRGKNQADIQTMIKDMRAQLDVLAPASDPSSRTTAVLREIVAALPEKAWLTRVSVKSPLRREQGVEGQLEVEGRLVAESLSEEQERALQFRDRLSEMALIKRRYPNVRMTVSAQPMDDRELSGLGGEALTRRLEERTRFSLTGGMR